MVGGKSVGILLILIVKLSNRFHPMSTGNEFMSPASDLAIVGMCVVPVFIVVSILTGRKAGSGWNADGAGRVGGIVASPLLSDLVDIRGADQLISVTAGDMPGMLIGHEKENVGGFHQVGRI